MDLLLNCSTESVTQDIEYFIRRALNCFTGKNKRTYFSCYKSEQRHTKQRKERHRDKYASQHLTLVSGAQVKPERGGRMLKEKEKKGPKKTNSSEMNSITEPQGRMNYPKSVYKWPKCIEVSHIRQIERDSDKLKPVDKLNMQIKTREKRV